MFNRVGQQLGNYQLVRLLGEGGFAQVYLGKHIYLGTQAAIKVLHTQLSSDDVDNFRTEASIIAHLTHPNIVRVLEFGVEGKMPFLVMDYAPNGTLRQHHPKGESIPLSTVIGYVKQVADALQYAHDAKLVHRDVKPENMLLGPKNNLLLSDFGIAMVVQSSLYQNTYDMAGTMAYMAPEQIQGKPRPASDQYSLGITVYEWLTGSRPFYGSLAELAGQHLSVPPPPLCAIVPSISPSVEQVVIKSLAKDPKQRYASVKIFATNLEQADKMQSSSHSFSVTALPLTQLHPTLKIDINPIKQSLMPHDILPNPSPPMKDTIIPYSPSSQSLDAVIAPSQASQTAPIPLPPTILISPHGHSTTKPIQTSEARLFEHRFSRRIVLLGLTGLTIAGSGYFWVANLQKPRLSSHTNPAPTSTHIPTPTSSPSPSPTSQSIKTALYTYRGVSGSGMIISSLFWSPNGKRIVSGSNDTTIQMWDALNGAHAIVTDTDGAVLSVAWSPDGSRIASGSESLTAQVWDAASGANIYTYRGHVGQVSSVSWSPDSKYIACAGIDNTTVHVWSATTGSLLVTYNGHSSGVQVVAWSPDGGRIASGSDDTTVQVWNAAGGRTLYTYKGHSALVNTVDWSPNGNRIVSGGNDTSVQVWDATTGHTLCTYNGHSQKVLAAAWSPNGKIIASSSFDTTVQVWDATNGRTLYTYLGHTAPVFTLQWSPDGRHIASGSGDQTVQVWQVTG